ncbi:DUF2889 domain-containing protein [Massilia niastensis]|uniref:DUF2889 domain-containing protein n=1 Tax=Massilia niastensis TaxID=544911 RepID=UPI00037DFD0A|nr:DUF2889 domain-containing protein [Massilia niastensis]
MTLPDPEPREALHRRSIELRGFRRDDGLYDVEARLVDTKSEDFFVDGGRIVPCGEPVHDMAVRLVVDEDLLVRQIFASTDATPYAICPEAAGTLQCLTGLRIGPGWSTAVRERLAGAKGCTHLTELLKPLATVAYQTLWPVRSARPADAGRPAKIDSCFAYSSKRELVRRRWPEYYLGTGED